MSQKLEAATNKVGRSLGDLLKVFEGHGHELSEAQVDKVFLFLKAALDGVEQKARLARIVSVATSGSFSLDMDLADLPAPSAPSVSAPTPAERLRPPRELADDDEAFFIDE